VSSASLGAILASPLLGGHEAVAVGGNAPLRLDAAASIWLIEAGTMELFAVAPEGPGGEAGPRRHLATAGPGELLWGFLAADPAGVPPTPPPGGSPDDPAWANAPAPPPGSVGLLAVAAPTGRLRRIELSDLRRLAANAELRESVGALLDRWLGQLTSALALGAGPRAFAELRCGIEIDVEAGRAARPSSGLVWARQLSGSCSLLGRPEMSVPPGAVVPVAADIWLITAQPCRLAGASSAELLAGDEEIWPALARFHRQAATLLAERFGAGARHERQRLERKTAADRQLLRQAYSQLAAVLARRHKGGGGGEEAAATADPLVAACRQVAKAQGMPFRVRPEGETRSRRGEHLAGLCAVARVRHRRVILRGNWWRRDNGPLLGFLAPPDGDSAAFPVALLPTSRTSYAMVNTSTGTSTPLDAKVAASLAGEAYVLYKPLAQRRVTGWDLLREMLRQRQGDLRTLVLMGLASGLLALLVPIATGQIFGHAIPDADGKGLLQLVFVLAVSALATSAFQLTRSFAMLRISARAESTIQAAVWDRLLSLPLQVFRRFTVGDLADRSLGIERIRELLTGTVASSILSAVFSVFSFGLLFFYSWQLALVAAALVALLATLTTALTYLQLRHQRQLLALQGKIASLLLGLIQGLAKLRVAGAEERAFSRWAERFAAQRRLSVLARRIAAGQAAFNAAYGFLTSATLFVMVAKSSAAGLPAGEFLAFNAAFGQFLAATLGLVSLLSSVMTIVPLYERLAPILETAPEADEDRTDAGELAGEVEFSHVSFRYGPGGPPVLDDVSFRAQPGEFIALVGPSGSGKSTCLRLLLGFEKPAAGSIYFDGVDLAALSSQSVRRQIGVVMQHSRPMAGDLFSNIIGGANLTLDDAWEAARMAGLEDDIRAMPMGMHTVVSENAETFSGGQRQRLLIARAIVNRPRILFFDEATSDLDNRTQATVSRSLEALKVTRIVIAHRLSTIINADRIYVIEGGRLVEVGTYRDLAARGGTFAELARRQIL
jgi:NHLM bacteriocin system ABC transporter ATP-binding protein